MSEVHPEFAAAGTPSARVGEVDPQFAAPKPFAMTLNAKMVLAFVVGCVLTYFLVLRWQNEATKNFVDKLQQGVPWQQALPPRR